MTLQIGDLAPDFEAETTEGRIRFHAGSVSDEEAKKVYPRERYFQGEYDHDHADDDDS